MSSSSPNITRIACFRFKPSVTPEQKADRAKAFLGLYAQHQDLIISMPVGGRPLDTPLDLTNVKRDSVWDMGFTVTFKVRAAIHRNRGVEIIQRSSGSSTLTSISERGGEKAV